VIGDLEFQAAQWQIRLGRSRIELVARSQELAALLECYNPRVLKPVVIVAILSAGIAFGQQTSKPGLPDQSGIKINYMNVCAPSAEEQAVIKSALGLVPAKASFVADFEISRGRTTMQDAAPAKFVRLRREFPQESPMMTAQYSMSTDGNTIVELMVFRQRDAKDFHEVAIEDRVSAGAASPLTVLAADTPAVRIRVERLSKPSVGVSRCEGADQNAYEPLFSQASEIVARYRAALGLRSTFRSDIAWLGSETAGKRASSGAAPQKTPK